MWFIHKCLTAIQKKCIYISRRKPKSRLIILKVENIYIEMKQKGNLNCFGFSQTKRSVWLYAEMLPAGNMEVEHRHCVPHQQ